VRLDDGHRLPYPGSSTRRLSSALELARVPGRITMDTSSSSKRLLRQVGRHVAAYLESEYSFHMRWRAEK
jgi:hypothetical protein